MASEPAIWIDGQTGHSLELPDRGLDYGDGLFETLLLKNGVPLLWEAHRERLEKGLQVLEFPALGSEVTTRLAQASRDITARGWTWCALRITITRGPGPRGYPPPVEPQPRCLITAHELERDCLQMAGALNLIQSRICWPEQPALAGIKHLNCLEQVLAANQARKAGADDCLMLDQGGRVVSISTGNVFVYKDGSLLTPPMDRCGIVGTRRERLREKWAPSLGLKVREAPIELTQLEGAQEVFVTNSIIGLRPVGRFGNGQWSEHPLCAALFQCYLDDIG